MTGQTRFDDRLTTILRQAKGDDASRVAAWGQISDILAQDFRGNLGERRDTALKALSDWQFDVPKERRKAVAVAIANPRLPVDLVTLFARDHPAVAAPVLARALLSEAEWMSIIPLAAPASRSLIRERRDLTPRVMRLLRTYGDSDFGLESGDVVREPALSPSLVPEAKITQISDLVARIEAFQRDRRIPTMPPSDKQIGRSSFRFETDADGVINWIEGIAREAVFGLSIADMAPPAGYGVDGTAAGAFRQRSEFHSANLLIRGNGEASGQWSMSARPMFDKETGRMIGYRGAARRPYHINRPPSETAELNSGGLAPDSARQLVHELRTPLNAISGFSEMISKQLLGPVSQHYRAKADHISEQATRLIMVFDDLDSDARLSTGRFERESQNVTDAKKAVVDHVGQYEKMIEDRGIVIRLMLTNISANVAIDPRSFERLIDRILLIILAGAVATEVITLTLTESATEMRLAIDRPRSLCQISDADLLDPRLETIDNSPSGPALGIAFTLRLISKLAKAFGGGFITGNQNFTLILPTAQDSAEKTKESS